MSDDIPEADFEGLRLAMPRMDERLREEARRHLDRYETVTVFCEEEGCDWEEQTEWEALEEAYEHGIDHWIATHHDGPAEGS